MKVEQIVNDMVVRARGSFQNARSDLEAVCLLASWLLRCVDERNAMLNVNAAQASIIAKAFAEADRARKNLAEAGIAQ